MKLTRLFLVIGAVFLIFGLVYGILPRGPSIPARLFDFPLPIIIQMSLLGGGLVMIGVSIVYEFGIGKYKTR